VEHPRLHAVDGGHIAPALVVLLAQPLLRHPGGNIHHYPFLHVLSDFARLWEVGDVGGITSINAHRDGGLEFFVTDVVDVNTGGFFEGCDTTVKFHAVRVVAFHGAVNRDRRPSIFTGQCFLKKTPRHHRKAHVGRLFRWLLGRCFCRRTGPGSVDLLDSRLQVNGASYVAGDLLPEGACAHFTGHQVRAVEAEAGGFSNEFSNTAFHVHAVHIRGCGLVGRQSAAAFQKTTG